MKKRCQWNIVLLAAALLLSAGFGSFSLSASGLPVRNMQMTSEEEDGGDSYEEILARAEEYAEEGYCETAAAGYALAIQMEPKRIEGWVLLLRLDVAKNDLDAFRADLKRAEDTGVTLDGLSAKERKAYRNELIAAGLGDVADALGLTADQTGDSELDIRFESGQLILEQTGIGGLEITADAFVFPEECLQYYMGESNVSPEEFYEEFEAEFNAMMASDDADVDIQPISFSPSGNSGLIYLEGAVLAYYNGEYRLLYPSAERGVEDTNGNLEECTQRLSQRPQSYVGEEGIVYSPDGRYAAVFNYQNVLIYARMSADPMIIDLSTGEIILTDTSPNQLNMDGASAVTAAVFSGDGRYLYYLLYGRFDEKRVRLCRYDLEEEKTEICGDFEEGLYFPHLTELSDGSFLALNDSNKVREIMGIVNISEKNGKWTTEQKDYSLPLYYFYPRRLDYNVNSGYAVIRGLQRTMAFMQDFFCFQVFCPEDGFEGLDRYLCMKKNADEIVVLTVEEYQTLIDETSAETADADLAEAQADFPYCVILNSVLSPDGQYMLVHTLKTDSEENQYQLYLIRLEDLAVREVTGPDPEEISNISSLRYMEWNTEQLIIYMKDGFKSFTFR